MTNENPNENGKFVDGSRGNAPARERAPESLAEVRPASVRLEPPQAPCKTKVASNGVKTRRVDWQMVTLWVFIVVSFAALAFTVYLLWAKSQSPSPF